MKCISQEIQNDLFRSETLGEPGLPAQTGEFSETEDEFPSSPQELRNTGQDILSSPVSSLASADNFKEPNEMAAVEEIEEELEQPLEETAMDWEDLTREQWSESDRLLQKVEKVGSKVLQRDFMSAVGEFILTSNLPELKLANLSFLLELVHVSQYKKAEEILNQRKARAVQGKKVITTGPWQIIDIPTKVNICLINTL